MKKLKFGIPKGSLEKATITLFEKSGWKINVNDRSYFPDINDEDIEVNLCRAQEMSRYVEKGTMDAGLTGKDWVLENESDVAVVDDLIYSKVSQNPARWVLLMKRGLTWRWSSPGGRRRRRSYRAWLMPLSK
jgi:ATP phosphoribosyltransferase